MDQITYETRNDGVTVYLGRKVAGTIKAVPGGWTYYPKKSKQHGDIFIKLQQVKQSIEGK
jgi:hypothetical protein